MSNYNYNHTYNNLTVNIWSSNITINYTAGHTVTETVQYTCIATDSSTTYKYELIDLDSNNTVPSWATIQNSSENNITFSAPGSTSGSYIFTLRVTYDNITQNYYDRRMTVVVTRDTSPGLAIVIAVTLSTMIVIFSIATSVILCAIYSTKKNTGVTPKVRSKENGTIQKRREETIANELVFQANKQGIFEISLDDLQKFRRENEYEAIYNHLRDQLEEMAMNEESDF